MSARKLKQINRRELLKLTPEGWLGDSRTTVADYLNHRLRGFASKYEYYFLLRPRWEKVDSRHCNLLTPFAIQLSLNPHLPNSQTSDVGDRHRQVEETCFVANQTPLDLKLRRSRRLIDP